MPMKPITVKYRCDICLATCIINVVNINKSYDKFLPCPNLRNHLIIPVSIDQFEDNNSNYYIENLDTSNILKQVITNAVLIYLNDSSNNQSDKYKLTQRCTDVIDVILQSKEQLESIGFRIDKQTCIYKDCNNTKHDYLIVQLNNEEKCICDPTYIQFSNDEFDKWQYDNCFYDLDDCRYSDVINPRANVL